MSIKNKEKGIGEIRLLEAAGGAASVQVPLGELADLEFEVADPFHEVGIVAFEFFKAFFHVFLRCHV